MKVNFMNLKLSHIHKQYGHHIVLKFDAWEIGGGIFWLKGGNGTGKTTLFRIISGLTPFDGVVSLDGVTLQKEPILFKSKISYAEAEPQYPLFVTGRDLLLFYQEVRKASQEEADRLSSLFEMDKFLDQKIGGYSSGMLKKLSLICTLIGDVALYILDEPLITIDQGSAGKLYKLINEKAKEGSSFLISSHQDIDAERLQVSAIYEINDKKVITC